MYLAKIMHADGFSRLAAVKLLHQRWSANQEIAQRMRDEARLLGWLRHRNIVDVMDLTTIGGRVAVIMEYLEAVDLKTVIQKHVDEGRWLPPRAALEITAFVASALDAAYNRPPYQGEKPLRVIHRDIKPSNVMVDESGTVKVLDFGVARADFDMRESHTQELPFGSVDYMPPERLFFEPETPFSDTYSLGATLYEMIALEKLGKAKGRPERHNSFLQERLTALRSRVPLSPAVGEPLEALLRDMLAYVHDQRPTSADVVARCRAIGRACEGDGLAEWAETSVAPLVKSHRDAPREPNPLVDSVLTEDGAFAATPPGVPSPDDILRQYADPEESTEPEPAAEVAQNDDRWRALAESVRQELGVAPDPGEVPEAKPVVERRVAVAAPEPEPEPGNPEDFDDVPTRVKEAMDAARPEPRAELPIVAGPRASPTMVPDSLGGSAGSLDSMMGEDKTMLISGKADTLPPPSPIGRRVPPPPGPSNVVNYEEEEAEPPKRSWLFPVIAGAFVVGLVLVVVVGGAGYYLYSNGYFGGSSPSVAAPAAPATTPEAPKVETPPAAATPITFVAKVDKARKLTAECDGKPFSGTGNTVGVPMDSAARCLVTVVLEDRSRILAEVAPVAAGTYNCFVGAEKKCSP